MSAESAQKARIASEPSASGIDWSGSVGDRLVTREAPRMAQSAVHSAALTCPRWDPKIGMSAGPLTNARMRFPVASYRSETTPSGSPVSEKISFRTNRSARRACKYRAFSRAADVCIFNQGLGQTPAAESGYWLRCLRSPGCLLRDGDFGELERLVPRRCRVVGAVRRLRGVASYRPGEKCGATQRRVPKKTSTIHDKLLLLGEA